MAGPKAHMRYASPQATRSKGRTIKQRFDRGSPSLSYSISIEMELQWAERKVASDLIRKVMPTSAKKNVCSHTTPIKPLRASSWEAQRQYNVNTLFLNSYASPICLPIYVAIQIIMSCLINNLLVMIYIFLTLIKLLHGKTSMTAWKPNDVGVIL